MASSTEEVTRDGYSPRMAEKADISLHDVIMRVLRGSMNDPKGSTRRLNYLKKKIRSSSGTVVELLTTKVR